jgi:hypothetical protein
MAVDQSDAAEREILHDMHRLESFNSTQAPASVVLIRLMLGTVTDDAVSRPFSSIYSTF